MALRAKRLAYEDYEVADRPLKTRKEKKNKLKAIEGGFLLNTRLRSRAQVFFIVFAVLAMAVTVRSGISASRGYALVAVQNKAQSLEQENERLRVDIAKLKSPQRIQSIAESELGLKVPSKMYFAHEK